MMEIHRAFLLFISFPIAGVRFSVILLVDFSVTLLHRILTKVMQSKSRFNNFICFKFHSPFACYIFRRDYIRIASTAILELWKCGTLRIPLIFFHCCIFHLVFSNLSNFIKFQKNWSISTVLKNHCSSLSQKTINDSLLNLNYNHSIIIIIKCELFIIIIIIKCELSAKKMLYIKFAKIGRELGDRQKKKEYPKNSH